MSSTVGNHSMTKNVFRVGKIVSYNERIIAHMTKSTSRVVVYNYVLSPTGSHKSCRFLIGIHNISDGFSSSFSS